MSNPSEQEYGSVQEHERANLRSPLLVLKVRYDDGRKTFFGYAKNISRGGVFIATVNPRDPGSRFHVEIPLPPPLCTTLQCFCEVIWKRDFRPDSPYEPGMGLRFIDLPEELGERLNRWIKGEP